MKVKRYKKVRKILASYRLTHNLKPPYKVAVDGEFLQAALVGSIHVSTQIPALLQSDATVCVTPCIHQWLNAKGIPYKGAKFIANSLQHLKCRHEKGFIRPFDCIRALISNGNPDRLLIGAQESATRRLVRHTAGVPLLFIHGSTVCIEAATEATKDAHEEEREERLKQEQEKEERKAVQQARREQKIEAAAAAAASQPQQHSANVHQRTLQATNQQKTKKKRKGPKEPNPLSVKKKKKPSGTLPQQQQQQQAPKKQKEQNDNADTNNESQVQAKKQKTAHDATATTATVDNAALSSSLAPSSSPSLSSTLSSTAPASASASASVTSTSSSSHSSSLTASSSQVGKKRKRHRSHKKPNAAQDAQDEGATNAESSHQADSKEG